MAPSRVVTSLVTFAFVAVDGARVRTKRSASQQGSSEEQASLVNSSYTPNTGCQGSVQHHYNYGNTLDNCGGQFETEMNNGYGGSHKKQPPHGGWFMVDTTARRRQLHASLAPFTQALPHQLWPVHLPPAAGNSC